MAAWERVLDLRPDDADALAALKGIYADLSRTDDLVRVLRKLLERAPDDAARVRELVDAARLLEKLRGDLSEVFECWRRAFVLTSGDRRPILAELRRLAEAADLWRRYADVLDLARKHADGPGEEAVFIVEQARVVERQLGEPERAFVLARAAFDLLPDDGPTLALLVRLAEARGAWDEVVAARVLVASRGVDRARRAELLRQAGEVTEVQLAQPDDAFELYAQALDAGSKEVLAVDLTEGTRSVIATGLPVGAPAGVTPKPLLGMPPFSGPQGPFAGIAAGADGTLFVSADADGSVLALRPGKPRP